MTEQNVCSKCGQVHTKCKAHRQKRDENGIMIPCKGIPMANGCCRMHSGNPKRGAEHYRFKDGRFSRHVPKNLNKAYQRAINDQELLDLSDYIAVLEARYTQILEQLEKYPTPPYKRIIACLSKIDKAENSSDLEIAMSELRLLSQDGVVAEINQKRCWQQLREMSQEVANLSAKEHKRRVENKLVVPVEQAVNVVTALGEAVREIIEDESLRVRVYNRVLEFMPTQQREVIEGKVIEEVEE